MTVIGSYQVWPEGLTWVFQGTVAEDATAGTHICSLVITPGAGNEMQFEYGQINTGATATSQAVVALIDDGSNTLILIENVATTTSGAAFALPKPLNSPVAGNNAWTSAAGLIISGTMRLKLQVTTAAVSVTQTFAVVCRIKGSAPTAVLADSVGTPVLTVNTSKVFG